jgi:AcrR family transcriptional regulator
MDQILRSDTGMALPVRPRVALRRARVRDSLLAVGARLFVSEGVENVSVEDVIAAADIARSTFYTFFTSKRDLLVRGATLGLLMLLVVFALLGEGGTLKDMAQRGAGAFTLISYAQVAAICLLTPLFMAGAIAQESNPRTWEVLLTTPLSSAQIVLGNLMGRLFFAIALLVATLPLCLVTRIFGGVRGSGIFASFTVSLAFSVPNTVSSRVALFWWRCTKAALCTNMPPEPQAGSKMRPWKGCRISTISRTMLVGV